MRQFILQSMGLLLAATTGFAGAAQPASLSVFPPQPDAGTAIRIDVEGEWPDACVPSLTSARVEAREIVLRARLADGPCSGEPRRYALRSDVLPRVDLKLVANGVHRVRFELQRGDAAPELAGFRLLYVGHYPEPGYAPETGFWWPESGGEFDRAGPGLGVQLEAQGRTLSLGAFGYDADGRSGWFFGAGTLEGRIARIELTRLRDGAGPFEDYRAPRSIAPVGEVHVELVSPSRVVLWFLRPAENGRGWNTQPLSMVRFRFAQEPYQAWQGRWVVLAEADDRFETRRIDFSATSARADGFVLASADASLQLQCDNDTARPNSPPARCVLVDVKSEELLVDFRDIGLNELRGWTGDGQRIVALKLNR